jgi:hypothetical protein
LKTHRYVFVLALFAITIGCSRAPKTQTQATSPSPAATENYPNLTVEAKEVNDAFFRKDYNRFMDLIYPKVIEMAGGRDRMLAGMTKEIKDMEAEGVTILESTSGTPTQFLNDSGNIYAVVPNTMKMKAKDGIFQTEGAMIGISSDGGAHWSFIDASGKDQTELRTLLPNVADKLKLPGDKPPVKVG